MMCETGMSILSNLMHIMAKKLQWYAFTGVAAKTTTGTRVFM